MFTSDVSLRSDCMLPDPEPAFSTPYLRSLLSICDSIARLHAEKLAFPMFYTPEDIVLHACFKKCKEMITGPVSVVQDADKDADSDFLKMKYRK
jgi:hypothetical protein